MESPPASDQDDRIQCLFSDGLLRGLGFIIENVKDFVFGYSPSTSDEPRFDLAVMARLPVVAPILLSLCCLFWVLIVLSGVEFVIRVCVSAVIGIPKTMLRGFLLIGGLCRNSRRLVTGRRSALDSAEQNALYDRWLDG